MPTATKPTIEIFPPSVILERWRTEGLSPQEIFRQCENYQKNFKLVNGIVQPRQREQEKQLSQKQTHRRPKIKLCTNCNEVRKYHAKGLCSRCYSQKQRGRVRDKATPPRQSAQPCTSCNKPGVHYHAKGLCNRCYHRKYMREWRQENK